jgi:hypothetical protein
MAGLLTKANPSQNTVARRPQTTSRPAASFLSSSAKFWMNLFDQTAIPMSQPVVNPVLKAVPGYISRLRVKVVASGGSGSTTPAVASSDGPDNVIQFIRINDVSGYPIVALSGINARWATMFGGQAGPGPYTDTHIRPSFSAIATSGNFTLVYEFNFEIGDAIGCILGADQSKLLSMQINLNPSSVVYSTVPVPTIPTLEVRVDAEFYGAPLSNPAMRPKALGTSVQWSQAPAANTITSGSNTGFIVPAPNLTGYLGTLIVVGYNNASPSVREDGWLTGSNDIELWIDQQPRTQETFDQVADRMARNFGTSLGSPFPTRPTGVLAYTFRDSIFPNGPIGLDDLRLFEATSTATLAELRSGAWGTITSGPDTMTCITQRLYPVGGLPQGIEVPG